MRERLSYVTIGIKRLKSDIWKTMSVFDFAVVTSALALTLTALLTSQYFAFNVLSFAIHCYVHCNACPNRTKSS
jgi:hypothetical protein